jgi:hypothetical protein
MKSQGLTLYIKVHFLIFKDKCKEPLVLRESLHIEESKHHRNMHILGNILYSTSLTEMYNKILLIKLNSLFVVIFIL